MLQTVKSDLRRELQNGQASVLSGRLGRVVDRFRALEKTEGDNREIALATGIIRLR